MSDPFLAMLAPAASVEPNPFFLQPEPLATFGGPAGPEGDYALRFDPTDDGIPKCADCKLEILDDDWVDIDDPADGSKRTVHRGCAPSVYLPPADVPPPRPRRRR